MGVVFGGAALELSGIVLRKHHQARAIGTTLLKQQLEFVRPALLTAHTRNPTLVQIVSAACGGDHMVYPLTRDHHSHELALTVPHSTELAGVAYHINRYGTDGLYGKQDPAQRPSGNYKSIKERFPGLQDIGTALVVVAKPVYTEEPR